MEGKQFSRKRMREVRERERMSQTELAEEAGTTQAMISAYERGKHKPGMSVIVRMLKALRCGVADLFE